MRKQINIQDLKPGMLIVRIIEQNGPVKIKKSGLVTSQDMVQGLIEMGIQQVEMDPDQTVEIEAPAIKESAPAIKESAPAIKESAPAIKESAPAIKKSATRRMLESNTMTSTRIDDSLSEQFHRSLFLPSVQAIPSAWQFYTKRYFLAVFIALGGLGSGWTLANYQAVLTLFSAPPNKLVMSVSVPVPEIVAPVNEQFVNTMEPPKQVANLINKNSGVIVNTSSQQVAIANEIEPSPIPRSGSKDVVKKITTSIEAAPIISVDLLESFQKAMVETEYLPVIEKPIESKPNNEDVPTVAQLPAWVMNRLPSMAFSVHMYASIDSERWVRVNGTRMVEGDKIDEIIEIVRIEPQHVILNYSGQIFSMAALTDW
jgi:general secretion pathway protein B